MELIEGISSYFAGESTATKPAKTARTERQRQIKQKNSHKRNASYKVIWEIPTKYCSEI
jgi:hypothetical protein